MNKRIFSLHKEKCGIYLPHFSFPSVPYMKKITTFAKII